MEEVRPEEAGRREHRKGFRKVGERKRHFQKPRGGMIHMRQQADVALRTLVLI